MQAEDKLLLKKFLEEQCTPQEIQRVQWLLQQPEAQHIMQELTWEEWNTHEPGGAAISGIMYNWQQKINARIQLNKPPAQKQKARVFAFTKQKWLRYAAVSTGLMVLGASAVWQVQKMTQQEHTAFVEKCNLQTVPAMYRLPDSSTVYLGPGSTLHYPAHFKGNTRELELKGEGFFEVTPDRDKPFILHTGAIQTRVLGTSFKVEAVDGQPLVVSVATGKVSVSTPTKELALLTPGRKITWYDTSKQAIAGQANIQVLEQWKTGEMVFEEQTMEQIARELQKRYRVLFVFINKGIADKTFSGTFSSAKPIDKILKTLSIAGRFHYERTGNRVINIYKTE